MTIRLEQELPIDIHGGHSVWELPIGWPVVPAIPR
jgi:hypothetical protein